MTGYSLNEVQAMAKKATRGAGYPWGLAEEAGQAVRWLCARGIDGIGALSELLDRFDGVALGEISPQINAREWTAEGRVLCPLTTGCALSDRATTLEFQDIRLGPVAAPAILFAFAACSASICNSVVRLEWPQGVAITDGDKLYVQGVIEPISEFVAIGRENEVTMNCSRCDRARPDPKAWNTLSNYAHRTYAPATEESRIKGAGADISMAADG